MLAFLEIKSNYGALNIVKSDLAKMQKLAARKEHRQLGKEAKTIDSARRAKTKSSKAKAIEKLKTLIFETKNEAVKTKAESTLKAIQKTQNPAQ